MPQLPIGIHVAITLDPCSNLLDQIKEERNIEKFLAINIGGARREAMGTIGERIYGIQGGNMRGIDYRTELLGFAAWKGIPIKEDLCPMLTDLDTLISATMARQTIRHIT
jgi:hypothetical protein